MMTLARSNYEVRFSPEQPISERIIFPYSPNEVNGIEDARFVRFEEDDGRIHYFATYTAYDGKLTLPQLIETDDFLHFSISTLNGPEVRKQRLRAFPAESPRTLLHALATGQREHLLDVLRQLQLLVYQGTDRATDSALGIHPIGQLRLADRNRGRLAGAHARRRPDANLRDGRVLLDLEDPARIIGRLESPLLSPNVNEREGYVPNVVYSCGGLLHGRELIIPYAVSDYASTFATVALDEVLAEMKQP